MMTLMKQLRFCASICAFLFITHTIGNAQSITQTIRGKVIDQDSHSPLIGANVLVVGSDPLIGASTDLFGEFELKNVPIGRANIKATIIGYEEIVIPNVLITSAKEVALNIELRESVVQMDELVINGNDDVELLNDMAFISARTFSVEETKRYAGSFNDPARMVGAYAGVSTSPEGSNEIIVRGNSPKGIQWRLEGIEIPNPNHFSEEGSTGGPINALNSAMLANSDFFTGAFPAEYGDVFSGLFDMRLRTGNNDKHEYAFSIGALGTDITVEGPFKKGGRSSYLFNYRYSTLAMLDKLGVVDFGGIPKYQDLAFKIFLPSKKGSLTFFGLGGKSHIIEETEDEETSKITDVGDYSSEMGVIGANHNFYFNDRSYLESSISLSENGSGYYGETLDENDVYYENFNMNLSKYSLAMATTLHQKINAQHKIQFGARYTRRYYDFFLKSWDDKINKMVLEQDEKGNTGHWQAFASWKYRMNSNLTLTAGVHSMRTDLNDHMSFEPRMGMNWNISPIETISIGFGIHAKMESLPSYFAIKTLEDGSMEQYNKDLDFLKARHYVVGYSRKFSENLNLKLEAYFQDLYDIPVENDPNSSFSLLNLTEAYTRRELVNSGTGKNYGLELTLERFFANNYYFMATGSIFESKYKAMDGIERDTYFNGNLNMNVLGGKEFILSNNTKSQRILGLNMKATLIGGRRNTPIDLEQSIEKGYEVRREAEAYSLKFDDVFAFNFAVDYRINRPKVSHVLKLDIQNVTNNQAVVGEYYDNGKIKNWKQLGMLPNILYTLEF